MAFLIIAVVAIVFYLIATKDQRAEKKEQKREEREQQKREMLADPFVSKAVYMLCSLATDLEGPMVKALRMDGVFYLVFKRGDIYLETRWTEKVGDSYEERKQSKCLLERVEHGKNPLSVADNLLFAEVVYDKLKQISWLDPRRYGDEIKMKKADKVDIPEVV